MRWLLLGGLLFVACSRRNDDGLQRYQAAYAEYEALVLGSKPISDPEFGIVVAKLRAIPADSQAHPAATELADRIERARSSQVPAPLTSAHAAECAHIAETGDAGAARECQQRLEAAERKAHDAQAP